MATFNHENVDRVRHDLTSPCTGISSSGWDQPSPERRSEARNTTLHTMPPPPRMHPCHPLTLPTPHRPGMKLSTETTKSHSLSELRRGYSTDPLLRLHLRWHMSPPTSVLPSPRYVSEHRGSIHPFFPLIPCSSCGLLRRQLYYQQFLRGSTNAPSLSYTLYYASISTPSQSPSSIH